MENFHAFYNSQLSRIYSPLARNLVAGIFPRNILWQTRLMDSEAKPKKPGPWRRKQIASAKHEKVVADLVAFQVALATTPIDAFKLELFDRYGRQMLAKLVELGHEGNVSALKLFFEEWKGYLAAMQGQRPATERNVTPAPFIQAPRAKQLEASTSEQASESGSQAIENKDKEV